MCLLPLTDHPEGTSHLPPQVLPTSASTSCRSTAIPRPFWWPATHGSLGSAGMATGVTTAQPCKLQPHGSAGTEPGLSLSWIHIFKQLGWSSASPISFSSRASAHAGISVPVAIRTPNCQAGMAVTNLSPCLYTPLSLCQIQQSLWDANAFTPTCFV